MTTKTDPIGAPESIESHDHIDLSSDSGLDAYFPDTFADAAADGINAARARYFARRRDSSPHRVRRGHPDADPINRPRELGYQKPALPLSFPIIVLVVSFAVFSLLAADHFAPKHDGRGHQNTSTATQNR